MGYVLFIAPTNLFIAPTNQWPHAHTSTRFSCKKWVIFEAFEGLGAQRAPSHRLRSLALCEAISAYKLPMRDVDGFTSTSKEPAWHSKCNEDDVKKRQNLAAKSYSTNLFNPSKIESVYTDLIKKNLFQCPSIHLSLDLSISPSLKSESHLQRKDLQRLQQSNPKLASPRGRAPAKSSIPGDSDFRNGEIGPCWAGFNSIAQGVVGTGPHNNQHDHHVRLAMGKVEEPEAPQALIVCRLPLAYLQDSLPQHRLQPCQCSGR